MKEFILRILNIGPDDPFRQTKIQRALSIVGFILVVWGLFMLFVGVFVLDGITSVRAVSCVAGAASLYAYYTIRRG